MDEWLGLKYEYKTCCTSQTLRVSVEGQTGSIVMPDIFFNISEEDWLSTQSMPKYPLKIWDASLLRNDITITSQNVPVIFGDSDCYANLKPDDIFIPIDIFGSSFFMLTRYEEMVIKKRDKFVRFSCQSSISLKCNLIDRPIIDEYLEILWSALLLLCPSLKRKKREFKVVLSHDVDRPSRFAFCKYGKFARRIAGDLLKRKDFSSLPNSLKVRFSSKSHLHPKDPSNTFDWIMDQSEKFGYYSSFYFICGCTNERMDADYKMDHPAIRRLLRNIHHRGHAIGVHPSFESFLCKETIRQEFEKLKEVCLNENIHQDLWSSRMHYLRWSTPETLGYLDNAKIDVDTTLGYADHAGFRCGTSHEYAGYDLVSNKKLNIRILPLVIMEASMFSHEYMNHEYNDMALNYILKLKYNCKLFDGNFTLLWHNSELSCESDKDFYLSILKSD